jgi:type IV pilus assembly protein PilF
MELAAAYFARGQNSTALDEVKQALVARPDLAEGHSLMGLIYASLGENKLAEESFQRALQLNPRDADAMHNFGFFLCQQRRFVQAEAQFQAALAVPQYSGGPRTTLAMGICQARNGQWADAERTLSRSYELDPASAVTAYNLSEVLLRRGELQRARFYIQRVNAVPEQVNAQSLWLAVRIERRLGDQAALQVLARQLRDRFPQSPEALQLERGRFDD